MLILLCWRIVGQEIYAPNVCWGFGLCIVEACAYETAKSTVWA